MGMDYCELEEKESKSEEKVLGAAARAVEDEKSVELGGGAKHVSAETEDQVLLSMCRRQWCSYLIEIEVEGNGGDRFLHFQEAEFDLNKLCGLSSGKHHTNGECGKRIEQSNNAVSRDFSCGSGQIHQIQNGNHNSCVKSVEEHERGGFKFRYGSLFCG
ncbi:hypothetical protein VNO78_12109 [Psophocarpus tetragonolobus]|uniref:Uncharacterized protein n=1 Tax=Psophocarpus tetragonolobus TaxID=3891 RepID=A0AAN9SPA4_PSOTE